MGSSLANSWAPEFSFWFILHGQFSRPNMGAVPFSGEVFEAGVLLGSEVVHGLLAVKL